MKKRLALILLILLLGIACTFSACSDKTARTATPIGQADINISLYAFNGESERVFGIPNLGHAFVSLKNISETTIIIGAYELTPNEEVTVGTWGQNEHWGIWYNLEAHYMTIGRYKGIVSISRSLSNDKIDDIEEYLKNSDRWTPFTNCSAFALALWNKVGEKDKIDLKGLITPDKLKSEIKRFTTFETNRMLTPLKKACFLKGNNLVYATMTEYKSYE